MKSVILAGGSGTRLWPLSRKNYPKQFLTLFDNKSFLQMTADRLSKISSEKDVYVIASEEYLITIKEHLSKLFKEKFENIITEPAGRNTAPAIALVVKYFIDKHNLKGDEILFISPSDHIIYLEEEFIENIKKAKEFANENIITFGIIPNKPETGYGYIEIGDKIKDNIYKVSRFVEKPNIETAKKYLESKKYMWNSGMFMFSIDVILNEFKKYCPELYEMITKWDYDTIKDRYNTLTNISIDYAVMEKSNKIICETLDIKWNDVGSWDSVYEIMKKDKSKNVIVGDVEYIDTKKCLVLSDKKLISLIGISDLIVVETEDAILICDRKKSQSVKDMVNILNSKKRKEVNEHLTSYRPWGSYTVMEEGERYKIKKIIVNQGESLSLQRHQHRSEHWIVIRGTALVQIGDKTTYLHENESIYVPKSVEHRLSNPGKIPLEIIEVQNGEYVGEDDIERIKDIYGRD